MKKGFTLIELLAVIIVLAVIALIATPIVLDVIEDSRRTVALSNAENYIKEVEMYVAMHNLGNDKYPANFEVGKTYQISRDLYEFEPEISLFSSEEQLYINDYIKMNGEYPTKGIITIGEASKVYYAEMAIGKYIIGCEQGYSCEIIANYDKPNEDVDDEKYLPEVTCEGMVCESESIIAILSEDSLTTGYYTFKVVTDMETMEYPVHLIVYNGNQTIEESMTFGDENDVSDGTNYAQNMVIVKVNGDLNIKEGATISPYYTEYGGPKGFTLYVTGKLTNNGTIDNSHGAYAVGENVYLWKNTDGTYEYVPAVGSAGGVGITAPCCNSFYLGNTGLSGLNRGTGGGGSGSSFGGDNSPRGTSGSGGTGTSYSGGAGGGSSNHNSNGTATYAGNGSSLGGAGGDGYGYRSNSSWYSRKAAGGAGNPGGKSGENGFGNTTVAPGENGTGGLLIIYADSLNNYGNITANGSTGGVIAESAGGSSGGGSINIFCDDELNITGNIEASGGAGSIVSVTSQVGGIGGAGTVTIGSISNGSFENKVMKDLTIVKLANKLDTKPYDYENMIIGKYNLANNLIEIDGNYYYTDNINDYNFTSSNPDVLTIDSKGVITANSSGTAVVTIEIEKYNITANYNVTVKERLYLYNYGQTFGDITGDYIGIARTGRRFSLETKTDSFYIDSNANYGGGGVYTNNLIDLSGWSEIHSYGEVISRATSDSSGRLMFISKVKSWGPNFAPESGVGIGSQEIIGKYEYSFSLSNYQDSYYVINGFNQSHGYIYSVWLER